MQQDCIYMIIGFLGKGGSGKSTLSTEFIRFLESKGKSVLAVDADHNMDLSFNLCGHSNGPFFGSSLNQLKKHIGLSPEQNYRETFLLSSDPSFNLNPADLYTQCFSTKISDSVRLMTAGPHTEEIFKDATCSHSLFTPLKIYLPYLNLGHDEFVVVDEKAGADGAGTGVASSFDLAVIVSEPTEHGVKTAQQIAGMLDIFETPYIFVGNKIIDIEDTNFIVEKLGKTTLQFPFSKRGKFPNYDNFETILKILTSKESTRKTRSKNRILKTSSIK